MHLPHRKGAGLGLIAFAIVILLVGGTLVAVNKFSGNIRSLDLGGRLGNRPTKQTQVLNTDSMNILVMGSDARIGQGDGFGQVSKYGDSARSDTTLLVHLYKGHKQAVVVSIPRDSWVTIPACTREDGSTTSPWTTKFNAAFSTAGPACTITTVEQLTGLYIDHFAVVDFKGFEAMVDAVGGVSMCLTAPVSDSKSHLDLPAGTSLLDGKTALAFVRTRYAMGDGSDTARIHRQQGFLSALTRKIKSAGVLLNPVKLYKLLDATTSSLTMDPAFASLKELQSIALSLKDLQSKNLRFVTVPSASDGTGNVVWTSKAQDLWDALKADALWPAPGTLGFDGKPLTVDPSDVHVDILNTTTKTLSRITDSMTALGYSIEAASETNTRVARTTISAGADGFEAARTLAAALGIRTVALDPTNTGSQVTLTIGRDFAPPLGVNVNPEFKDANSTSIYGPSSGITADNSACTTV
jgi:LCP family protein required for cell wall assembly